MFSKSTPLGFLLIITLLSTYSGRLALADGIFKDHWYSDPTSAMRSSSSVVTHDHVGALSSSYPHEVGMVSNDVQLGPQDAMPYNSSATSGLPARSQNCPRPTVALLRVRGNDHAMVWVNDTRTKPQMLAGIHRGSRIFSVTRLVPDEIQEVVVQVQFYDGSHTLRFDS